MARDYFINGECLVKADGSELGLASDPVTVSIKWHHKDITVDAFGMVPPEVQFMLAEANISMTLVHMDRSVLDTCMRKSMGGAGTIGQMPRAGSRMGTGATNNFVSLSISSPVATKPWTFPSTFLVDTFQFPLGTEKSLVMVNFRAIPFVSDPQTATGAILWTYT